MTSPLLEIDECYGLFVDAALTCQAGQLRLLSAFGRDTAVQEFLARLSLPRSQNGLPDFALKQGDDWQRVFVSNVDQLKKLTCRVPQTDLFGELVHLVIYDPALTEPDLASAKSSLLLDEDVVQGLELSAMPGTLRTRCWELLKSTTQVPVLDHWQDTILELCRDRDWLTLNRGHRVGSIELSLDPDSFNQAITQLVQGQTLTLAGSAPVSI